MTLRKDLGIVGIPKNSDYSNIYRIAASAPPMEDEKIQLKNQEALAKKLINEANKIKNDLQSINYNRERNQYLNKQFQSFLQGKIIFDPQKKYTDDKVYATEELKKLIISYEEIAIRYNDIKTQITSANFLSDNEIGQIEKKIFDAKDTKISFFPAYQREFEKFKEESIKKRDKLINVQHEKINHIEENYNNYSDFRSVYFTASGIMSILGVGIPFLLGGLLGLVIVNIKNAILTKISENKIEKIKNHAHSEIKNEKRNIEKNIQSCSPTTQLNQAFFGLAKQSRKYAVESLRSDNTEGVKNFPAPKKR